MTYSKIVIGAYIYVHMRELTNIRQWEKDLTAVNKYDGTRFPMYRYVPGGNWFGIPLYYDKNTYSSAEKIIDNRIVGNKVSFNFTAKYREGQEKVINTFSKNYKAGKTGFILGAKPGSGKTVLGIKMLSIIGRRALVVVPRENLVWQWMARIQEHSNLSKEQIGFICGKKVNWKDKEITVALVHTLATDRFGEGFRRNFGCVIFDEVHSSVPPRTFSPVLAMFPARIRIGMSATLERDDGLDIIFRNHIGQVYLRGNASGRMQAKVITHYFKGDSGYLHMPSLAKNRRGMLLSLLAKNIVRNKLIVWYILSFLKSKRRVAVLSDRVEQLKILQAILKEELKKYPELIDITSGFYVGMLNKKVLKKSMLDRVARGANVILATYQKFDLGTDIQDLAGIIYGTPQKLIEQKQGRAERGVKGKKIPVVIDIVDVMYKDTVKWFKHRCEFYNSSGTIIKKVA